jgi:hypothetical protein
MLVKFAASDQPSRRDVDGEWPFGVEGLVAFDMGHPHALSLQFPVS